MFKTIRPNKKVTLYFLTSADKRIVCTITDKLEQCHEYFRKLMLSKKWIHYTTWCDLHDKSPKDEKSEQEYFDTCIAAEDKKDFIIQIRELSWKEILASLRMYAGCLALGCSYELKDEIDYSNYMISLMDKAGEKNGQQQG